MLLKNVFLRNVQNIIKYLARLDMFIRKSLTLKPSTLLAVLFEQMAKEILPVTDIRNIELYSDEVCGIRMGDLLQIYNIHVQKEELKLSANEHSKK